MRSKYYPTLTEVSEAKWGSAVRRKEPDGLVYHMTIYPLLYFVYTGCRRGLDGKIPALLSAIHRVRAKERQSCFSKNIEVFRGMVHANRGRILPENHIQHPMQLVLD